MVCPDIIERDLLEKDNQMLEDAGWNSSQPKKTINTKREPCSMCLNIPNYLIEFTNCRDITKLYCTSCHKIAYLSLIKHKNNNREKEISIKN